MQDVADRLRGRWNELAVSTGDELREQLRRFDLAARDRERLAARMREVIDSALDVPPDLPARMTARAASLRAGAGPGVDPVALAWRRTRLRAQRTAAIGAVTTVPLVVPGLGPPLAALGLVADWRFAARQQRDLVLEIAALFDALPDEPTPHVRALFLASTATAFGSTAAGDAIVRVLGRQLARRSVSRLVPGAGAVAAGAFNYVATAALGRYAIRHFAAQAGIEVRGTVPELVHPAMPRLRNATLHAFENEACLLRGRPPFAVHEVDAIAAISDADRCELLDLAATAATDCGRFEFEARRTFSEIAGALGFEAADAERARRTARRNLSRIGPRIGRLAATAGLEGRRAAHAIWRRARRLAGRTGPGGRTHG